MDYQLRFWQKANTFREIDVHDRWVHSTAEQRTALASDGTWYRKLWSLWLPGGIRIRIVRVKQ